MSPRRIVSRPGVMWGGIGGPRGGLRAQPDKWVGSCASVEGRPQTGSEDDTSEERTKGTAHRDLLRWRNSMSGPSIHPSDWSDKTMLMFGISLCGALLVAESGWYQFQSNYCSKKFCPGIFVYCPLVAVCHPFCICVFCNCICFLCICIWLWILFFCPLVAVCHPSVGADWPESDIWKYFHQIASPNWQH